MMREKMNRRFVWRYACLLLFLAVLAALAAIASVVSAEVSPGNPVPAIVGITGVPSAPNAPFTTLFGRLSPSQGSTARTVQVTDLSDQVHIIDLPSMGVHPIQGAPPASIRPNGGAVGLGGAFMSVSPDVVSQSVGSEVGTISANWMPGETVAVSINGGAPTNITASASGRIGTYLSIGSGEGYITIEERGLTSGRQTGGLAEVRDSGAPVPGLAIGPHAINPNGSSTINVLGTRWQPGSVTLARNGVAINTLTAGANGTFYYSIPVAAGSDTSAIYTAYTTTVGSQVGQSIEERADAGVPPIGDQNFTRAFVDRPVAASSGGTAVMIGEGFLSGETVNVTGCGSFSGTADSNGAAGFFVGFSGSNIYHCVLTGGTTGRVGRASALAASNVTNAPASISYPAAVSGGGTFRYAMDRLLPNQSGTVYIDGVAQGNLSTDSDGKAAALLSKPASGFLHSVRWIGASGQTVNAPLLYLPAGGTPTRTATPTSTPTNTPTHTAIIPTHTPTNTPTRTATNTPQPTQTPGGPTATTVPSDTPTYTPTHTSVPSSTPAAVSPTPTHCAITFEDAGTTFLPFEVCLACREIISGYPCGGTGEPCNPNHDPYFRPGNPVTRAQISKIVSNAAGFSDPVSGQTFQDVPPSNTFYQYIGRLASRSIISGYPCGGTGEPCVPPANLPYFRPGGNASRGQLSKIVCRAFNCTGTPTGQTFQDVPPTQTFYVTIEQLYALGAINGYPCGGTGEPCIPPDNRPYFRPGSNVSRGQTSKIVANVFFPNCSTPFR